MESKTVSAVTQQMQGGGLHQALASMVEEAKVQGKEFRYIDGLDGVRRWAAVDFVRHITGLDRIPANTALERAISALTNEQVTSGTMSLATSNKYRFPGRGQRDIAIVSGELLVPIMTRLPNHHPRVAAFIKAVNDTATRYLGGDTSLAEEVHAIRAAQESLPDNHPARAFGEAVERGAVGRLPETVDQSKVDWHMGRGEAREGNKDKAATIKDMCERLGLTGQEQRDLHMMLNAEPSKAVCGSMPSQWKKTHNLPPRAATRDFFSTRQHYMLVALEASIKAILQDESLDLARRRAKIAERCRSIFELCEEAGYHQEKPGVPPALNKAENRALEDKGGKNQLKRKRAILNIQGGSDSAQTAHRITAHTINNYTIHRYFAAK